MRDFKIKIAYLQVNVAKVLGFSWNLRLAIVTLKMEASRNGYVGPFVIVHLSPLRHRSQFPLFNQSINQSINQRRTE
ncbi:hypothetical protein P8452_67589 [Trifolium repens]|nr:hypothetical protein P8452_67589 [Trifolium repens]